MLGYGSGPQTKGVWQAMTRRQRRNAVIGDLIACALGMVLMYYFAEWLSS